MNRLFVAYKPKNISSNFFLKKIKRKYGVKKAGFSGTLDPFAEGVLIMAFGQYTKLFRFLDKAPKKYRATLWLGASSPTLDIEKVEEVKTLMPFSMDSINIVAQSFIGELEYLPPKYSAKRIAGKRAYQLARDACDFELKTIKSTIYDLKIVHYMHPFLTFEISISEGGYVRSIGNLFAQKLGVDGILSALHRFSEGRFEYHDEKALAPLDFINVESIDYRGEMEDIILGRKLDKQNFDKQDNGIYKIVNNDEFALVELHDDGVDYVLNKVKLC
ncbi:tRNA pseudouridine(55) synthase TruB [Sulfurospirillum sp. 1612]|uniref:tRNA pseudouridine(55) synthase TruB n=1 Tax=Sulfurospirillum sp. 1612 TaxID=3094835 RepID=UPI002F949554